MASEAGLAKRAEQVAQGFEAEEVETFVGDFELCLRRVFSELTSNTGGTRWVRWLVD